MQTPSTHPIHSPESAKDTGGQRPRATRASRGTTLIETAIAVTVIAVVGAALSPTLNRQRQTAQSIGSLANLSQIGQISAMYGNANDDQFATFSWQGGPGVRVEVAGEDHLVVARNNFDAQEWEATDILRRLSGRVAGNDQLPHVPDVLPHRRWNHLVLQDFAGRALPDPLFVSPDDALLNRQQADPDRLMPGVSVVPSEGSKFRTPRYRQRIAYSSSYLPTTFIMQRSELESPGASLFRPVDSTVHLFSVSATATPIPDPRMRAEVAFPALKVHYFQEFDWQRNDPRYYAFDDAKPHVLMMDGSAARRRSSDATVAVDPRTSDPNVLPADSVYQPLLSAYPASGEGEVVNQKFRFTKDGLAGFDFTTTAEQAAAAEARSRVETNTTRSIRSR